MARIIYRNKKGIILPSVTTVLNNLGWKTRPLMIWAYNQGLQGLDMYDEQKTAAQIGTVAHKLIEIDCLKGCVVTQDIDTMMVQHGQDITDDALVAFESWQKWKKQQQFGVLGAEESMVSEELQVGGTPDLRLDFTAAIVDGERSLVSLKVTKGWYEDHIVQEAAYAAIWNENNPDEPIEAIHWLILGKSEPSFSHHWLSADSEKIASALRTFKHLRAIHDERKILRRK